MLHLFSQVAERFNSGQRKIISNAGWLFASKVFRILVSLLISVLVARYLQPEGYGKLQYALAFCSFFLPLSTAQMGDVVTRDLVRQPEDSYRIMGTAFAVQLAGGILAGIAAIGLAKLISPDEPLLHLLVGIVSLKFIFVSFQPIENWFDAKVASRFKVFATNIAFAAITAIEFWLIANQAPLYTFAVTVSLESLLYSAGLLFFYWRDNQNFFKWKTDFSRVKYLLIESLPLCLSSTSLMLYKNIDRVMLANMVSNQSVGIYSSAAILAESLSFLPTIICVSLYPTMIKSRTLEPALYQDRLQKIYDAIAFAAYGLILFLVPLSGLSIDLLYGQDFQAAAPILSLYLWSSLFTFLGIAQSRWIVAEGLQQFNFYSRLAGLIANLLLNLLLIPAYREMGAAIATVISYAIGNYLFFLIFPQTRGNALLMTRSICLPFRLPRLIRSLNL